MAGKAREEELTVDECLNIASELLDLGCKRVTFIGGEVFLYKGWEKIARRLSNGGIKVNIVTNASLLGNNQIDQIKYAQLTNVGISLDGMEKNHNRIRNSKDSFQRVLKAFRLLNNEKIPIAVVTSLLDFNFLDLDPLYDLLLYYNVPIWQLQIATSVGNMSLHKDILLNPSKVPQITKFIREKRMEGRISVFAGDNIGYYDENEICLRNFTGSLSIWHGCQAGLRVVGIDSVGNVKGCLSLYSDNFIEGNLRQESLYDIWCKEDNFDYNRKFDISHLSGACAKCDLGFFCRGGCRGSCYFTTGSNFENVYCCYSGKGVNSSLVH